MPIIQYLEAGTVAFPIFMALVGLAIGSFVGVVVHRLPLRLEWEWRSQCRELLGQNGQEPPPPGLVFPRSRCPHCNHAIPWYENIPLLSYLLLRGRCSACQSRISPRYPVLEILSALLAALCAWRFGFGYAALFAAIVSWVLLALAAIDIDHKLLPDDITLPFLWLGLAVNLNSVFTDISSAVIGAIAGYTSLWLVFIVFKLLTGKEGMGYGDFKLFAMLGAWLGWQMLPAIILLASLCGALVGITLILTQSREAAKPIPFGPYLAGAGWIALLWGADLNSMYLRWAMAS